MKLVVISPERDEPREIAVLGTLLAAGLERYHVRKPGMARPALERWLLALPREWLGRLVLHQHHELADTLGLGGVHHRDAADEILGPASSDDPGQRPKLRTSRSCHELATLRAAIGRYDSVFLSPVFPSISKPGYAPRPDFRLEELASILASRNAGDRRTAVLALGGITSETAPRALALGFDGVAVLGAIWQAADPLRAFSALQNTVRAAAKARTLTGAATRVNPAAPAVIHA